MTEYTHFSVQYVQDVLVISITTEEISGFEVAQSLRNELVAVIEKENPTDLILNLSQVNYIASMGLVGFVTIRKVSTINRIILCELAPQIRELLILCKLLQTTNAGESLAFEYAETVFDAYDLLQN